MVRSRHVRIEWCLVALLCATLGATPELRAASFPEFVDPNPAPGNSFGIVVVPLSTGNVVIVSPNDDAGGSNAGAVYLFNGSTGALISTLRGSTANDQIGGLITALPNGNFVISSQNWDNGAAVDAGAVTWGSGTTGVSGTVSAANSLVGSNVNDRVGNFGVVVLSNGNYLVRSSIWNNGGVNFAGAVTWGSGTTGVSGAVSAANSLVGSTASDQVGSDGSGSPTVTALTNGNYLVASQAWDNGAVMDAGAVTWGNGTSGVAGTISSANSLVGSTFNDRVGIGTIALSNGNYVVRSYVWDNGATADVGAATWGSGTTGVSGTVSAANSLVGTTAGDGIGLTVTALSNGNYLAGSVNWDNGATANAGAVSWVNGTTGASGAFSSVNSLVGTTAGDNVGTSVTALPNGHCVVASPSWDNGATVNVGAVTWMNGTTTTSGNISAANSLVGPTANDQVGGGFPSVVVLANGNYVVRSPNWDNAAVANAGAVSWGNGTTGVVGTVSPANSLVGSTANDAVGFQTILALSNGNYVVRSQTWDSGAIVDAGAATWGSGTTGVTGTISAANSLVGSTASDGNSGQVVALSNGNYVVTTSFWNNGAIADAGAATWGNGATGTTGTISATNSLVGSAVSDQVGSGVIALTNGNYVVRSPNWNNGATADAGAATWGNGNTGISGTISAANSLVGTTASDQVSGGSGAILVALSNGDYVVTSPLWNNGATTDAGAATWGSGGAGVFGAVSSLNSMVGGAASTTLIGSVANAANNTFLSPFTTEGGGRVRVGPTNTPIVVSADDIPDDQGGWLRLTFLRSSHDDGTRTPPVATYGVWRKVPGTFLAQADRADARTDAVALRSLRVTLPDDLDAWEKGGQLFVSGRLAETEDAFPPGNWALVTSVPAVQQAQYLVEVPTISNAAPNDFVVTAHATTPAYWVRSNTVSGQSVDNLAPAEPTGLIASYLSGQTNLNWTANSEHDLGSYSLHRGASAGFTPTLGNRIASQIGTSFADVGQAGSFYKLSALDVNGNESTFALITPDQTTGVAGNAPVAFALEGIRPNPARGNGLHVALALPSGASARLELLDVSGRRVLAREVGSLGAGRHTVNLAEGQGVLAGIYWVRLTQGPSQQRQRVAVVE